MGAIIRYECAKCGYSKDMHEGSGMRGASKKTIEQCFPKEIYKDFNDMLTKDMVSSFFMKNSTFVCRDCNRLMTAPVLHFDLMNGEKRMIAKDCPECGGRLEILPKMKRCPKCGEALTEQEIGLWD